MSGEEPASPRGRLRRGLWISVVLAWALAFAGQVLIPGLARLPGLFLCGGGGFEIVLRRRTSYGVCADGAVVDYWLILAVSLIVWSIVCVPLGMLLARWFPGKAGRG